MKYARTKDGIYSVIKFHGLNTFLLSSGEVVSSKTEGIKISNNPIELCDEWFIKRKEGDFLHGTFYEMEDHIETFKHKVKSNNPIVAIYGAITIVDRRGMPQIKSVIEMNEKGELELL